MAEVLKPCLAFAVKLFPPTANHCYFNHPRGGRAKTTEATAFERRFVQAVHEHLPRIQEFFADRTPESVYSVIYVYHFPHDAIVCKNFGTGKKGAAQNRYKKVDAENRTKLVSDALATALGVDDHLFFDIRVVKSSARKLNDEPQIWIFVQKADPAFFGV